MITYNNEDYIPYKNAMELIEDKDKEIERLNNIRNKAIEYNKEIRDLYEIGEMIRSNADTNLVILEDKETLDKIKELKGEVNK